MNELERAALLRVRQSVEGKPADRLSYSRVRAGDVVLLAALAPADDVVRQLGGGAKVAADDHGPDCEVYQTTEHLRHLLSLLPA